MKSNAFTRIPAGVLVLASAGLAFVALPGCERPARPADTVAAEARPVPVRSATVASATFARTQTVTGTVRPLDHALVSARVMGLVSRADFTLGQRVPAGAVLVTLDAAELAARVAQADFALAQAVADHERELALLAKAATPADTVRTLARRRQAAEAALAEARALLGYTEVRAPFTGAIARKLVNSGDLAAPGTPLFELVGDTGLRAEVEVPASLPSPDVGATLSGELAPASGPVRFTGALAEIASASDPLARTRLAKITLPTDTPAHSGDFVRVEWPAGDSTALVVPAEAVSLFGQMERVFVIQEGRAVLRLVKTAGPAADRALVRVASGLDVGEVVVLAPPATLRDGQRVESAP